MLTIVSKCSSSFDHLVHRVSEEFVARRDVDVPDRVRALLTRPHF